MSVSFASWMLFVLVAALAAAVPGPAVLFVISQGLSKGVRQGFLASFGILAADAMYLVLSSTGLHAILLASYRLFACIKWVGAVYVTILGVKAIVAALCKPGSFAPSSVQGSAEPARRTFAHGFVLHASNPKALLYFSTLVPQFLRSDEPLVPQLAVLGATHLATAFFVLSLYGVLAAQLIRLGQPAVLSRYLGFASGFLLLGAGAGMALIPERGR